MKFSRDGWKKNIKKRFAGWKPRTAQTAVNSLYLTLAATAVWPVAEAYLGGNPMAIFTLGSLLAGVGGNLLADAVLSVKAEKDTAVTLQKALADTPQIKDEIDAVLTELAVVEDAQNSLAADDKTWFLQTLQRELTQLGNLERYSVQLGDQAVFVDGDHNVVLGANAQQTVYNIDKQIVHPPTPATDADDPDEMNKYLNRLLQRCNNLPIAALGGHAGLSDEVGLDKVYIALDTRTKVPVVDSKRNDRFEKERPLTALEIATSTPKLVLLGDPGSGKSSFVRQLAARVAKSTLALKAPLPDWEHPLLPLMLTLRELAQALNKLELNGLSADERQDRLRTAVFDQWRAQCKTMHVPTLGDKLIDLFDNGQLFLLFDGLDEVANQMRPLVQEAVRAITALAPTGLRIIITCRIRSYSGPAMLPGFSPFTLAPFNNDKIRTFVAGWYKAQAELDRMAAETAVSKTEELQAAATGPDLNELATNPMLLTTMAIIHQSETTLPKERVKLYSKAVDVLLRRWQRRKGITVSEPLAALLDDTRQIRAILNRLGYEAHQLQETAGAGAELSRGHILTLLETSEHLGDMTLVTEFLDYVDQRAGLLVGQGGRGNGRHPQTYSFPHRTFQEYLAGCYMITGRNIARTYWQHMQTSDYWYLAAEFGSEELLYNKETPSLVLDLMYDLCPATEPQTEAEWRGIVWSGRMAALLTSGEIKADTKPGGGVRYLDRVRSRLADALRVNVLHPRERAGAGRDLARLGDTRPEVLTVEAMRFCFVPKGAFCMGSDKDTQFAKKNEAPAHKVNIPYGYWISKFPITNAQFQLFIADNGYKNSSYWPEAVTMKYWSKRGFKGRWENEHRLAPYAMSEPFSLPNHPVINLTWYEAIAFTHWLTHQAREQGWIPSAWHITLPSEAEWEKSARGGQKIPPRPIDEELHKGLQPIKVKKTVANLKA
ncbi:MAG: SUMF1/EgtB/PvdO family nonheme iron enzyme, partial [bacterium]|nr:SUMF1/EgtB/PvdO family nonheme iron enzyme [bacterium]